MLEKVNHYFTDWISQHFFSKKAGTSSNVCCFSISSTQIFMSYAKRESDSLKIQWCESFPYSKIQDLRLVLEGVVEKYKLKDADCLWMLHPSTYQAFLLEMLPVSAAEFQSAIRFKIKDMLTFPVADAVIDHISLPIQVNVGAKAMIMVVVSRLSFLQPIVDLIQDVGLNLTTIDIYEFAMRNLTGLFEQDEKTSALIYMEGKSSMIVITSQKNLYFSRVIEIGLDMLAILSKEDAIEIMDKLGLEIQRSFDFFQTQWRKPMPARIFVSLAKTSSHSVAEYLSQRLSLSIQTLNIQDLVLSQSELSVDQQGKFLPVIGGLLREDVHATEY